MKRAIITLLLLSGSATIALAQQSVEPGLVIDLGAAGDVDAEALRSALESDLGLHVELGVEHAQVVVEASDAAIEVRVLHGARPLILRTIDGTGDRAQRTLRVALLISNLVRDQSSELLAMLAPAAVAPIVVIAPEPRADEAQVEAATEPAPAEADEAPSPSDDVAPAAIAPAALRFELVPLALDLVPGVGVSSAFLGRDERVFAIGALGAWSGMLTGVSLSGIVDVVEHDARGSQIGGLTAISGPLAGVQIGGLVGIVGGTLEGVQIGGALGFAERVLGVQLGGLVALSGGVANGVQLAGASAIAAGPVEGTQISIVNVAGGGITGAQLGIVNVTNGGATGAQIGIVNIAAGRVSGLQLGLVNVSDDADASIGIVNVHARGRFQLRAGADTTGLFGVSAVHGGRVTHSILSLSIDPLGARLTGAIGAGIGARIEAADIVHVDIDALAHVLIDGGTLNGDRTSFLLEPRVVVGVSIVPGVFGLYAGLSYQWLFGQTDPGVTGPVLVTDFGGTGGARAHGWPALLGGIELF